jgi:hypothetical protein
MGDSASSLARLPERSPPAYGSVTVCRRWHFPLAAPVPINAAVAALGYSMHMHAHWGSADVWDAFRRVSPPFVRLVSVLRPRCLIGRDIFFFLVRHANTSAVFPVSPGAAILVPMPKSRQSAVEARLESKTKEGISKTKMGLTSPKLVGGKFFSGI